MNAFPPSSVRRPVTLRGFVLAAAMAVAACSPAAEEVAHGDSPAVASPFPTPGTHAAATANPADSSLITVYKTPTCGCCREWVDHMRKNGFRVAVTDVAQLAPVKAT